MDLYDISPPITDNLAVWPGDTPPRREMICHLGDGSSITLSTLHATVHLGAHADAPNHYGLDGDAIDTRSLGFYLGTCQVLRVEVERGQWVGLDQLQDSITTPRILFATNTYPDPTHFNEDFAALAPALIDRLAESGVRLVGIDTPSVDLFDSTELPTHHAILGHDMAILEGLILKDVPAGMYELLALPLRLVGFDASPVRAVLRSLSS